MIQEKIQSDLITALKSGEREKVETLRYILSQIKNKEIDKKSPLSDEEVATLLRKQMKDLQESIDAFDKGGRTDLSTQSKAQQEFIKVYLPAEISDEELKKEIERVKSEHKDLMEKDPKAIMGICIKELKSKADPSRIVKLLQTQ